jgi:hypothetical protein
MPISLASITDHAPVLVSSLSLIWILLLSSLSGLERRDKGKLGRPGQRLAAVLISGSALSPATALAVALWQHTTASTAATLVNYISRGIINAGVGSLASGLMWLVFATSLFTNGMALLAISTLWRDRPELETIPS